MPPSNDEAIIHCTACGRRQSGTPHLCEFCGAPLTAHAGTDPVLGIMARGFAAYQATRNPRKPIVVIGVWLWMAPVLILGLMMASLALSAVLQGISKGRWGRVAGDLLWLCFSSAMVLLPFAILFRTTEAYFRQKSQLDARSAESADDELDESMKCLSCGQTMPQDANVCNSCGWSFSDSD
jgi:hypothetical protein